jgi:hypothetical protein
MFLVALNYPPDLGAIDAALDEHNAWLPSDYCPTARSDSTFRARPAFLFA